jgi:hypothetical protein
MLRHTPAIRPPRTSDQGLALPIALIIGALLLVASAGLAAKLLMLRRTGAVESYKQLAEMASSNGLNRILADLNDIEGSDISYLWHLSQNQEYQPVGTPIKQWDLGESELRPVLEQPCVSLNLTSSAKNALLGGDLSPQASLREDGRPYRIGMQYRLRSYSYSPGDSKATFYVEGYATQSNGSKTQVLARSLLTRVLALRRYVTNNNQWAVLAARNLSLGSSSIIGSGKVLWLMDSSSASRFANPGACSPSSLGAATGSSNADTQARLWPVVGTDFPSPGLFDQLSLVDQITSGSTTKRRIWNIDDRRATTCAGLSPGSGQTGEAICTRGETDSSWSSGETTSTVKRVNGVVTAISLHAEQLCNGNTSQPCLIWIESIQLRNGAKLSIETASSSGSRPMVLRLLRPQESIKLSNGTLCQADYQASTSAPLPCSTTPLAERLAIVASNGDEASSCSSATQVLSITGGSLPAALVLMPQGSVSTSGNAAVSGLIWAKNICAAPGLILTTTNPSGNSIIDGFKTTWKWDNSLTFGRTVTRGIRGTGLDLFRRW